MAERNDNGVLALPAAAAIAADLRVIINSSGQFALAGLTDNDIGTLRAESFAAGDERAVYLRTKPGTLVCVAAGAITVGALVYTAASGKISATGASTSFLYGRAMETASGNNSKIAVLPMFARTAET